MSIMKKLHIVALLAILALVPACSDTDDAVAPPAPETTTQGVGLDLDDYRAYQLAAPGYTYEVALEGDIDLSTGGTVTGRPASWPDTASEFSYTVLPDAVVKSTLANPDAETVRVKVWVPVYESEFPDPEFAMPMILEPDGLAYTAGQHATVELSYHPSLTPSSVDSGYQIFCIDDFLPGDAAVGVVAADGGQLDYRTRIRASVAHHSRWVIDKTDADDDDSTGN
ncbi:MAG: hypothetical protein GY838_01060 [bacterium]|nr:hypothetical protein [bacterium]